MLMNRYRIVEPRAAYVGDPENGTIGEGAYGVVYKALDTHLNVLVALKKIRVPDCDGISASSIREITFLMQLKHENVTKLRDVIIHPERMCLIFDLEDCDLSQYMANSAGAMSNELVQSYTAQILEGIAYCHSMGVMHRDLKPQNILVSKDGQLRIADFGLARAFTPYSTRALTIEVITRWYRPPEVLLGHTYYDHSVDIWSIGCIIAEMSNSKVLFKGYSDIGQIHSIFGTLGTPHPNHWPGLELMPYWRGSYPQWPMKPPRCYLPRIDALGVDLVVKMLQYNPKQRISAKNALHHPFVLPMRAPQYLQQCDGDISSNAHNVTATPCAGYSTQQPTGVRNGIAPTNVAIGTTTVSVVPNRVSPSSTGCSAGTTTSSNGYTTSGTSCSVDSNSIHNVTSSAEEEATNNVSDVPVHCVYKVSVGGRATTTSHISSSVGTSAATVNKRAAVVTASGDRSVSSVILNNNNNKSIRAATAGTPAAISVSSVSNHKHSCNSNNTFQRIGEVNQQQQQRTNLHRSASANNMPVLAQQQQSYLPTTIAEVVATINRKRPLSTENGSVTSSSSGNSSSGRSVINNQRRNNNIIATERTIHSAPNSTTNQSFTNKNNYQAMQLSGNSNNCHTAIFKFYGNGDSTNATTTANSNAYQQQSSLLLDEYSNISSNSHSSALQQEIDLEHSQNSLGDTSVETCSSGSYYRAVATLSLDKSYNSSDKIDCKINSCLTSTVSGDNNNTISAAAVASAINKSAQSHVAIPPPPQQQQQDKRNDTCIAGMPLIIEQNEKIATTTVATADVGALNNDSRSSNNKGNGSNKSRTNQYSCNAKKSAPRMKSFMKEPVVEEQQDNAMTTITAAASVALLTGRKSSSNTDHNASISSDYGNNVKRPRITRSCITAAVPASLDNNSVTSSNSVNGSSSISLRSKNIKLNTKKTVDIPAAAIDGCSSRRLSNVATIATATSTSKNIDNADKNSSGNIALPTEVAVSNKPVPTTTAPATVTTEATTVIRRRSMRFEKQPI